MLEARPGGPSARFAELLGERHPVVVFLSAALLGYVALAGATIAFGLLLTKVVLQIPGVSRADERAVEWLVDRRTPFRTDASFVASVVGSYALVALVVLIAIACAVLRQWRIGAFMAVALIVESASYRVTTLVVHRERPHVARLEHLPVDASYPSGHVAASVAVYCGLALLVTSWVKSTGLRVACWTVAGAIPLLVAVARMYRGMHHPLDSVAGLLMGIAALSIALFAARAAGVAVERRRRQPA